MIARTMALKLARRIEVDDETDCWIWPGQMVHGRYPAISVGRNGKQHIRPLLISQDDSKVVVRTRATCGTLQCINPDHLVAQTINSKEGKPVTFTKKLTSRRVYTMRQDYRQRKGSSKDLSERYGVSDRTVRAALSGERWASVPGALTKAERQELGEWWRRERRSSP